MSAGFFKSMNKFLPFTHYFMSAVQVTVEGTLKLVKGDICQLALETTPSAIVQQCNCVTKSGFGLSATLSKQFPYCDIYSKRTKPDTPGTVKICLPPTSDHDEKSSHPVIVNLLTQFQPGRANGTNETYEQRLQWLKQAWIAVCQWLESYETPLTIFIPQLLGCGLAGGDPQRYQTFWQEHLSLVPSRHQVVMVSYDG